MHYFIQTRGLGSSEHNVGGLLVLNTPPAWPASHVAVPAPADTDSAMDQGLTLVHFSAQPEPFLT